MDGHQQFLAFLYWISLLHPRHFTTETVFWGLAQVSVSSKPKKKDKKQKTKNKKQKNSRGFSVSIGVLRHSVICPWVRSLPNKIRYTAKPTFSIDNLLAMWYLVVGRTLAQT
ncbi:hypothetical protein BDZ45DRAFT_105205 [Acephala macrosclerotiorum]|nr:hypothetical protein BDZ45DRAFT_105205 [Acephala macrosclerotiorum]